jgi:hypothetical protein
MSTVTRNAETFLLTAAKQGAMAENVFTEAVSASAAVVSAAIALYSAWDARRSAAMQRKLQERSASVTREETRLQRAETARQASIAQESLLMQRDGEIRAWADAVIDCMSEASTLTFFDPDLMPPGEFFKARASCLWRLSSLLDRGRMFFPNERVGSHGSLKPAAYRGFRPAVLDEVKAAFDWTGKIPNKRSSSGFSNDVRDQVVASKGPKQSPPPQPDEIREHINNCKRLFVSEVQEALDPRARSDRLQAIVESVRGQPGVTGDG